MTAAWMNEYIARCQVAAPGTLLVDHVTWFVPDIDAAQQALDKLTFTVTPVSGHLRADAAGSREGLGGNNRCVMLRRGYLAFLAPVGDTPLAGSLRTAIGRYTGIHSISLGTANPEADRARLQAAGVTPQPLATMRRPVDTPDGEQMMEIVVARPPEGTAPESRVQFVQQKNPEILWQRRWLDHVNRAFGLAAVFVCSDDPAGTAAQYGRYTGLAVKPGPVPMITTARGDLVFLTPERVKAIADVQPTSPGIVGCVLECSDTMIARSRIEMKDLETKDLEKGRFSVAAPPEIGGFLTFGPIGKALPDFV